jgi:hypothetical protein
MHSPTIKTGIGRQQARKMRNMDHKKKEDTADFYPLTQNRTQLEITKFSMFAVQFIC